MFVLRKGRAAQKVLFMEAILKSTVTHTHTDTHCQPLFRCLNASCRNVLLISRLYNILLQTVTEYYSELLTGSAVTSQVNQLINLSQIHINMLYVVRFSVIQMFGSFNGNQKTNNSFRLD